MGQAVSLNGHTWGYHPQPFNSIKVLLKSVAFFYCLSPALKGGKHPVQPYPLYGMSLLTLFILMCNVYKKGADHVVFKLMNDCENAMTSVFSLIVKVKSNSIEFRHLHNRFTGLGGLSFILYFQTRITQITTLNGDWFSFICFPCKNCFWRICTGLLNERKKLPSTALV